MHHRLFKRLDQQRLLHAYCRRLPEAPSAAATTGSIAKCAFGAAVVAALEPLTKATSRSWFFGGLAVWGVRSPRGCVAGAPRPEVAADEEEARRRE